MAYQFEGRIGDNGKSEAPQENRYQFEGIHEPEEKDYEGLLPPREAGMALKTVGSHVVGLPGNIWDMFNKVVEWGSGAGEEKRKEIEQRRLLPTSEEVSKKIESAFPETKAISPGEEKAQEIIGTLVDLGMPFPGEKMEVAERAIRSILGTAAGEATEFGASLTNLPEWAKSASKTLSQIIPMVAKGKIVLNSEESKKMYEAGKILNLTDEQLTPLIQTKGKTEFFAPMAKISGKVQEKMKSLGKTFDSIFTGIKEESASLPKLTDQQKGNFIQKLEDIKKGLSNTINPSSEKEKAINFLSNSIERIKSGSIEATPESLVNYFRDLNQEINWKSFEPKYLHSAKEAVKDSIRDTSQELANKFESYNKLMSKMYEINERIPLNKELRDKVFYGEVGALFTSLFTGTAVPTTLALIGERGMRKISEKFLTDPNWQNITRNTIKAASKQSPKALNLAFNQLKEKIKEDLPEYYEDIENLSYHKESSP